MIYAKIFKLSTLSNQQLVNALGIDHTQRKQFEKSKKIDLETIVRFCQSLNISQTQCTEIVQNEIKELYKK